MQLVAEKPYVVVGLGLTGLSCARYLKKMNLPFIAMDTRQNPPGIERFREEFPEINITLGTLDQTLLNTAEKLVVSPGVDLRTPAIQAAIAQGVGVTGDIDLFAQAVQAPIIAITGSNAKSTVTTLVGEMARAAGKKVAIAGNIGTPVLDLLSLEACEIYVLELSSFQLETTSDLGAMVATVLNISADHMDRYDSLDAYIEAKNRIFKGSAHIVVNRDDMASKPVCRVENVSITSFGLNHPGAGEFGLSEKAGEPWLVCGEEFLLAVRELQIAGEHNVSNALAALALGSVAGFPMWAMLEALRNFAGLKHRCQWVAQVQGVRWYNDSKGTNVGATVAAIKGLGSQGKIILLAGGVGKGADFSELGQVMAQYGRMAIVFGEDAHKIAAALESSTEVRHAETMKDAVAKAYSVATPDDLVLLSPACASFDMFNNYEHRGDVFIDCVRELH